MRLALAGEQLPLWIVADVQTGGRGRAGRSWTSLPGNLQASVAVRFDAPPGRAGEIALVAGVALIDAVAEAKPADRPQRMRLKWPNDLMIDGAKAGGILVETTTGAGGLIAVVGFGVNVAAAPDGLGRAATSLNENGISTSADELLGRLAAQFEARIAEWRDGAGFAGSIAPAWRARSGPDGEVIAVTTTAGVLRGRCRGIDNLGHLVLDADNGTRQTVTHGDVALLASAEGQFEE